MLVLVTLRSLVAVLGELLPRAAAERASVRWKPDGSPVTNADLLLEAAIEEHLRGALPDLQFVSEEREVQFSRDWAGWTAIVDPLDGTENFISGIPVWGTSVSLWQSGEHRGSLLAMPEMGIQAITGDALPRFSSRVSGLSSSFSGRIDGGPESETRIFGCATFNLYLAATRAFSSFENSSGAHSWDIQAGIMLALDAGRTVKVDGEHYDASLLDPTRKYRFRISD